MQAEEEYSVRVQGGSPWFGRDHGKRVSKQTGVRIYPVIASGLLVIQTQSRSSDNFRAELSLVTVTRNGTVLIG
jgi:hypothetical protein